MKTLDDYMSLPYRLEIIPDTEEGGYGARYPELLGCVTCAETMDDVVRNAIDAKREWLAVALEDGVRIPEPEAANDYSGQFKLRLPKSLHKGLAERAKQEGISMNQYCLYLLTNNHALHTSVE